MRALIQRVTRASVTVAGETVGEIGQGLLIFLGVAKGDTSKEADWLVDKIVNLRIFGDENDKMNLSLVDIKGEALVVSQFTLYGDCRKGRRPGFDQAGSPQLADELYEYFTKKIRQAGVTAAQGRFAAYMDVALVNDGPVTFMLEAEADGPKNI